MDRRTLLAGAVAVLVGGLVLRATRARPRSAEDEIRALIARAVDAAERKDVPGVADTLSDGFLGQGGASKTEVKRTLLGVFMQGQQGVAVLNPRLAITIESATAAAFSGTFVFAQRRDADPNAAEQVLARYEIDGRVEKSSGEWTIVSAAWRQ